VIFIHGVATRESNDYRKECATRNELLQHFVLEPLATRGDRFKNIAIRNPYWGDLAANFRWVSKPCHRFTCWSISARRMFGKKKTMRTV